MEQADWRIRFDELKLESKIASGEFGAVYAGRFFGAKVSERGEEAKGLKEGAAGGHQADHGAEEWRVD
jgi:hypothetical protein